MIINYILLALSSLLKSNSISQPSSSDVALDQIKQKISDELSRMTFKLLVGIVLISAIIFSVFQLGIAYQIWLKRFENSFTIEVISFSFFALAFSLGLYFLFNRDEDKKFDKKLVMVQQMQPRENTQSVVANFAEGVMEGFEAR